MVFCGAAASVGCAPLAVRYDSAEYVYLNKRVENSGDPSWSQKTVFTFDSAQEGKVLSALVYKEGDETKAAAFQLYTYWSLDNLSNRPLNNRLRMIETYTDSDIFKKEGGGSVKDPAKTAAKLVAYSVYESDASDGKTTAVTEYRYNAADEVIENRNVPMKRSEYSDFSGDGGKFLPDTETISLFLAEQWVFNSVAKISYEKVGGKKVPVIKRFYLNPATEESCFRVETFSYDEGGRPTRRECYSAVEFQKAATVRVPEKTVLYVTEDRK